MSMRLKSERYKGHTIRFEKKNGVVYASITGRLPPQVTAQRTKEKALSIAKKAVDKMVAREKRYSVNTDKEAMRSYR